MSLSHQEVLEEKSL